MRLFAAICLPDHVRKQLAELADHWSRHWNEGLLGPSDRDYLPAKWVPPENLHVTLKFFGEVADADVNTLCDALRIASMPEPATVIADHIECLPPRGPVRIIAVGLGGEIGPIESLFEQIERQTEPLGFRSAGRGFRPHVTLARVRDPLPPRTRESLARDAAARLSRTRPFEVCEFVLMRSILGSTSPQYHPVSRFPLPLKNS